MQLSQLKIQDFRNITSLDLKLSPRLNYFYGANGAGKTSILECLYLLSTGHSFRSRQIKTYVRYGQEKTTIFAKGEHFSAGISKSRHKPNTIAHHNGENIKNIAIITKELPTMIINAQSFNLLCGEPEYRRQRIDWALFHVEHGYHDIWRRYYQALKHRNCLLSDGKIKDLSVWDLQLSALGEEISQARAQYIQAFCTKLSTLQEEFLGLEGVETRYLRGWTEEKTLLEALSESREQDFRRGFTQCGPHRADIKVLINKIPARDLLSRGQLKLFIFFMYYAQLSLSQLLKEKGVLLLLDDLAAEFDTANLDKIIYLLKKIPAQICITGTNTHLWEHWETSSQDALFHVEELVKSHTIEEEA